MTISDPLSMATEGLVALCETWKCEPDAIRELRVYRYRTGGLMVAGDALLTTSIPPHARTHEPA